MITKTASFKTSTGKVFETIEEAQQEEIGVILGALPDPQVHNVVSKMIVANKDKIVDVLTTGPKSKPRARSINGGTRKRTPRVTHSSPPVLSSPTI